MLKKLFRKNSNYQFKEAGNTACFVCDHVINKERNILYVSHDDEDSSWQFMCGQSDHTDENIRVISMKQATNIDQSINALYEMPEGVCAKRTKVGSEWKPYKMNK